MTEVAIPLVRTANTFTDADYDRRILRIRMNDGREAVCVRARSIEVALAMAAAGECVCVWEGPYLIARKLAPPARFKPISPWDGCA